MEQANLERALAESLRQHEVESEKRKSGLDASLLDIVCLDLEDLENNKECAICFEEQACGDLAVRLLCGHCFHQNCCVPWFKKNTTCPVCRLEVDASEAKNQMSEQESAERAAHQAKMKQRRDEKSKRLQEQILRMRELNEENGACVSAKRDGLSPELVDECTAIEKTDTNNLFDGLSIKRLKKICKSLGLESESNLALERSDIVELLQNSFSKERLQQANKAYLQSRLKAMQVDTDEKLDTPTLVDLVVAKSKSLVRKELN